MVAGALLPPYGGLTANVSAPYMAAALVSRNSLEWSDTTIKNQIALNGPMEAVNRRHARFAGSKFKATVCNGAAQLSGPVTGRGGDRARPFRDRWSASATNGNSAQVTFARVSTRVNSLGKIESGHGPTDATYRTKRHSAEAAAATNDHSLIRPNERRRRCGRAIKSEMVEAIDKYIKADRNARLIETKEEGRLTDLLADRVVVVVVVLGPSSGPLETRAMRNCRFSHEALDELPGPQCSVAALQRCSRARKCA
ncbi:hypothetical protein G5I_09925 [Acromyrmex echinatior]|uniref:Uncharacterized protein n=1 Tax=Acromyrmex echinatior TaxID=103372 RepID=F4WVI5_ACREC|nr:hypothetical protein G5I_09925 [Acromyrmex echinatior]